MEGLTPYLARIMIIFMGFMIFVLTIEMTHMSPVWNLLQAMVMISFFIGVVVLVTSCSPRKTLPPTSQQLYEKSTRYMDKKNYLAALETMDKLQNQFPFSAEARNASLLSMYAYYKLKKYPEVDVNAEFYLNLYPYDKAIDFVYYIQSLSLYAQIKSHKRNLDTLLKTRDTMNTLVQNYPESEWSAKIGNKLKYVNDMISNRNIERAQYNHEEKNLLAAIRGYQYILENNDNQEVIDLATENLQHCKAFLGVA